MRKQRSILLACLLLLFLTWPCVGRAEAKGEVLSDELRERAVGQLRIGLEGESGWAKVHAAEALLTLGYPQGVREAFEEELEINKVEPGYRIGIWRVLAQTSSQEERPSWVGKIREAFLDLEGPDRVNAAETLGKLGYQVEPQMRPVFEEATQSEDAALAVCTLWALAGSPADREHRAELVQRIEAEDALSRQSAAYALRFLPDLLADSRNKLIDATKAEPNGTAARAYLLSSAFIASVEEDEREGFREELIQIARTGEPNEKAEVCHGLAHGGAMADVATLVELLDDTDPDVRVAAAAAILRIGRRVGHSITALDWLVIAGYALGMIGVGWYYSRRTKTTDDYLLGGRTMKPWAVGLSLFATLLSTLTYLAMPGEMIQHGPMILAQLAAYPFIVLVVGWLMIPFFMKLQVTSAYEILELRLGAGVCLLGSFFFLSLRLMWMAMIIYATTSKVLIPLLGWDPSAIPYACAVLGVVTVIYTSMGGIRAVVLTDVVQTFILFGGAVLTMVIITVHLGGVDAWWPTEWAATWDPPKLWFDPGSRVTIAAAFTASFTWYICTAGSDQMAIQRYLATRDVKAARRMFAISVGTSGLVTAFLGILGFALLAYFQSRPWMLADGQTIASSADMLLPRFILLGLPVGISGLVVAALLAAAMSSLSSGINSSCSVITVDLVDRFRRDKKSETDHVRLAKYVSWLVGAAVVVLSCYAGLVPGNLLEATFKVANLLVAPLFVLFFMAMFVPWATSLGTLLAAGASTATAIGIAFYGIFDLGFLWIMPGSLLAGIVTGMLLSLLPDTRNKK
ncbi:sodium:solute symporter family transporter [Adhaeretor mobilis]|uniref:Sodium/glucose cotransporter n=1 Tax=Adhaeretor mobilis TaxID=1930276 RepID=A0A517MTJ3_9BACT|nr:sodium/solute symporter [Adhaeretor mobilis]QDS98208.1 Sodium/glucose cotransporter [Adhaeretor mobilis]